MRTNRRLAGRMDKLPYMTNLFAILRTHLNKQILLHYTQSLKVPTAQSYSQPLTITLWQRVEVT